LFHTLGMLTILGKATCGMLQGSVKKQLL